MHPDDIVPFLQEELYGLEWSQVQLEKNLEEIYTSGRGVLDPASLVHGESWLDDALKYGFADAPAALAKPFADFAPVFGSAGLRLAVGLPCRSGKARQQGAPGSYPHGHC